MAEDGYIKFKCNWIQAEPFSSSKLKKIDEWRNKLYNLNLIGAYSDGIGYGNISTRLTDSGQFIITGSATGNLKILDNSHYTKVVSFDLEQNSLTCKGPIKASSESLTHAVIYQASHETNGVIHVHNLDLWEKLIHNVPTTAENVEYGTPEMAKEVIKLFEDTDVKTKKIFVMAGHKEGIFAFGKDLDEAGKILLDYV